MRLHLRPCTEADFDALLAVADAAVPFDPEGNRIWLKQRRTFDETTRLRRHYVVEENGRLFGYAAIEQQSPTSASFRIYVVPVSFDGHIEDLLFDRLTDDFRQLGARHLWMREYAHDHNVRALFSARGFRQTALVWDMRLLLTGSEPSRPPANPLKITTLAQEQAHNPADLTPLYELSNTLRRQAGRSPASYETFTNWLAGDTVRPDASFLLWDGPRLVGLNFLTPHDRPGQLLQTFAGLLPMGDLETAAIHLLRHTMIEYAHTNGYSLVTAYIADQDKAWLQLNEQLGFGRPFGYVTMERELSSE